MTPATYVEKVQTFIAAQWDGSDESAGWILSVMPGATREDDTISVRDSMDRQQELPPDTWVVQLADGSARVYDEATFGRQFQPAGT